jgi:predicted NBD/HSP70 family sugar kinase
VIGRRLIRGAAGFAGELAHLRVEDNGPVCVCGSRGCLAQRADLYEIVRLMEPAFDRAMTLERVIALSADHDEPTRRLLSDLGRVICEGLGPACALLNPDAITIDGTLAAAAEPIIDGIRDGVARTAPAAAFESVTINVGALGSTAQLFGALSLVYSFNDQPR